MANLILYTIEGPLFKCVECDNFVISEEHNCEEETHICSDERLEEIKEAEKAKQNGTE
jgi:hypothetical protein